MRSNTKTRRRRPQRRRCRLRGRAHRASAEPGEFRPRLGAPRPL